jgi:hypothetical protein
MIFYSFVSIGWKFAIQISLKQINSSVMKKVILIILVTITSTSIFAQLKNTRWKGTIKGDNPRNVILDFKKDTAILYTISDSTIVERMTYTMNENSFTVKKIDGQSDCDNTTPGKYSFVIKNNNMLIKLINDACYDRSSALDTTKWTKWKNHPEVKVSENILKQYVGVYELDAQHPINITLENGRLNIEGPNNNLPKSPLISESNTKFFLKLAGVEFDFVKDANGKVVKMISHEEKDYELKKIK